MPSLDSVGQQVGDFVVIALLFFGLLPLFGPLDVLLPILGYDAPRWLGYVLAGAAGAALSWIRPLRLRLVVRVWLVGLVTLVVFITALVFFELDGNAVGIVVAWGVGLGLGVGLAYPPLWRAAEARLRVD
ncbi:hypothetical protein GJR96_04910 [Haloferax sp. MBLA0076]|uniref:DUF4175 domain-containing protein n=1 Tax=Haloferax litoreum TaxID=2666140 RepID=A0A6A8GHV2_9EURY|nr:MULTISPECIES: hypothetical protein [Haloferax]KAB1192817.1 hypothetical protein Hfx1148_04900 [Haloferax sp. CBA1148]MRX21300.1 hypothetical protein [Haloferax litoreum]